MVCYGAGLRISEAVALKITDIDSARMVLRIEDGKGGDGRFALLSPRLLAVLRTYFRALRPTGDYLFPSWRPHTHVCAVPFSKPAVMPRASPASANASLRMYSGIALPLIYWKTARIFA